MRFFREVSIWQEMRQHGCIRLKQQIWEDGGYDFLICPVMAVPALEHQRTKFLSPLWYIVIFPAFISSKLTKTSIFTVLFNMVDSTVGVIPVTKVDKTSDTIPPDFLAGSQGSKILEGRTYSGSDPAYDATKMHGLPVGVQIVGKPWEEEKVLAMMGILEKMVDYAHD